MEVLRVNDDNFRNKLISFCSVNCEGETLYWAGNDSLKDILAWWNSEDFAGPANDDYVLQLIVKGRIIFDYCNEYAHGSISNDIPSFEQMLHMLEAFDTWIEDARNKAIPVKECEPLMRITDIEWDLDDIEDEAEAYSIRDNLPKSEDLGEFIEEDQIADYLSDKYGYCVKSFDWHFYHNPDLLADIYVAYYENGERKEFEYFDINNFFEDMNTDRLSFPKPSAELHEVKMNGKELYPADFAQLLSILGYKDNMKDEKSSVAVAKASVMHDKSYYLDKFKDKIAKCEEEERNNAHQEGVEYDSSFAKERFDEECNAEEIVGYYINYYEDDALKTWRENIEGRVITDEIRDVTRILEYLYTSEPYAISPQTALTVLAANMPKDFNFFNSSTGFGEPEHLMDLPNGRFLKIIYQKGGEDERYYSWQVMYSTDEVDDLDYTPDDLIISEEDTNDFTFDTVYNTLDWAIRIATETPKYEEKKPKFSVGDAVRYTAQGIYCYVIDTTEEGSVSLFDTEHRRIIYLPSNELYDLVLEGHSDMAEKVFS